MQHLLYVSFALFAAAAVGLLASRNLVISLMFLELMLNAANLALAAQGAASFALDPQVFVMFVFAVAAAEAGVGLAIVILLARRLGTLDPAEIKGLKG